MRVFAALPQVAVFAIGFLLPVFTLVATSLARLEEFKLVFALDLQAYSNILRSELFWRALQGSLLYALSGAVVTCLAALPFTLYLTLYASRRMRVAIAAVLLLPLLTNYVVRAYALKTTFANQGVLNYLGGLVGMPPLKLLYTPQSIIVGYFFYFTAIAVLAQWAGSGRLSREYVHTAADLGAAGRHRLFLVILPLAARGIALQLAIVFAFALSDTIIIQAIGGSSVYTLSTLLLDQFKVNDWPQAAATSVLITFIAVPVLALSLWIGLRITRETQWEGVR